MRDKWDWILFFQIAALATISVLIISSINPQLARNQIIYWILGLCLLFWISKINYHNLVNYSIIFYTLSLFLLILLIFFGEATRGSVRWFDFRFIRIQPSEIAKAATILQI